MTKNPKLSIGIALYGTQDPQWWIPLAMVTSTLHKVGVDFQGIFGGGSMLTDSNRNLTVKMFLESESEWLLWIDTDNITRTGAVKRLLDTNRTLVSGLYFNKKKPYNAIAYHRLPDGFYRPVDEDDYERGEIIPINAAGVGALLTHRSVYEDIEKNFTLFQTDESAYRLIANQNVNGKVDAEKRHHTDSKVVSGQLRTRLIPVHTEPAAFPYFQTYGGRTEDMHFFECAAVAGHKVWLDTSVEEGHLRKTVVSGETRRMFRYKIKEVEVPRTPESVIVELHNAEVENESP
jgi:hypothetical protein